MRIWSGLLIAATGLMLGACGDAEPPAVYSCADGFDTVTVPSTGDVQTYQGLEFELRNAIVDDAQTGVTVIIAGTGSATAPGAFIDFAEGSQPSDQPGAVVSTMPQDVGGTVVPGVSLTFQNESSPDYHIVDVRFCLRPTPSGPTTVG